MSPSAAAVVATLPLLMGSAALRMAAPAAARYADGAPAGFSGGFQEQSCDSCHFHAALNSGPGRVIVAGIPERFVAGERYALTVTLERPGMKLGGFQLTARFRNGGTQAGVLAPATEQDDRLRIEVQQAIQYAGQRQKGTELTGPGRAHWSIVWTAPPSGGPVVFHVAANAADGDGSVEGDYIHTAVVETSPAGPQDGPERHARKRQR